ncbi:hypothetical protein REPUB_Repub05bG0105200 [Reevesia pubescens]
MASADVEFWCFVRGLAWATDDRALEEAFSVYGEIVKSKLNLAKAAEVAEDLEVEAVVDTVAVEATVAMEVVAVNEDMVVDVVRVDMATVEDMKVVVVMEVDAVKVEVDMVLVDLVT